MSNFFSQLQSEQDSVSGLTADALASALRMLNDKRQSIENIERLTLIKSALEHYAKSADKKALAERGIKLENGEAKWIE